MNAGDKIICRQPHGYRFSMDKEYTVLKYEEAAKEDGIGFTWPAYVQVQDDEGREVFAHASRFKP